MATCKCVRLVTSSYFQSCNIRSSVAENPMLYAHLTAVCYTRGAITDGIFTLRVSSFVLVHRLPLREYSISVDLFYSCDLDVITFIYEPDPYSLEMHRMCKYELPMSRLSRLSDRQTDRTD